MKIVINHWCLLFVSAVILEEIPEINLQSLVCCRWTASYNINPFTLQKLLQVIVKINDKVQVVKKLCQFWNVFVTEHHFIFDLRYCVTIPKLYIVLYDIAFCKIARDFLELWPFIFQNFVKCVMCNLGCKFFSKLQFCFCC